MILFLLFCSVIALLVLIRVKISSVLLCIFNSEEVDLVAGVMNKNFKRPGRVYIWYTHKFDVYVMVNFVKLPLDGAQRFSQSDRPVDNLGPCSYILHNLRRTSMGIFTKWAPKCKTYLRKIIFKSSALFEF